MTRTICRLERGNTLRQGANLRVLVGTPALLRDHHVDLALYFVYDAKRRLHITFDALDVAFDSIAPTVVVCHDQPPFT